MGRQFLNILRKMRLLISFIAFCGLTLSVASAAEEKLSDYLHGLLDSHELAIGLHKDEGRHFHITTYLSRLKLKDPAKPIPADLEYDLWRHFCDCHHLCQVFYHQTYWIGRDLPIVGIMNRAFPGFKKAADGEGGVWIDEAFKFLKTVDPHAKAKQIALDTDQDRTHQSTTCSESNSE